MPLGYEGVYVIHGPPGAGKTTRCARTVGRLSALASEAGEFQSPEETPAIVVSLTRAAAAEAAGRDLPLRHDCVGTLHSLAYRSIGRPQVVEPVLIDAWNLTANGRRWHLSRDIIAGDIDDGSKVSGAEAMMKTSADQMLGEIELLRHRLVPVDDWSTPLREFHAAFTAWKRSLGLVDFTDMIELSEEPPYRPAVILADEAQDLSSLERACLERWRLATGAALILVGDGDQALYVWRGAAPQILYDTSIPANHVDVLSQSYRVPRAVHRLARSWIARLSDPHLEIDYKPRDHPGAVERIDATLKMPDIAIGIAERAAAEGKTCLLLAQANYMANSLAYALRARLLPHSNPWRKKNGLWNPLAPRKGTTIVDRICALLEPAAGGVWTNAQVCAWTDPIASGEALARGAKAEISAAASEAPDAPVSPTDFLRWLGHGGATEFVRAYEDGDALAWWASRLLATKRAAFSFPIEVCRKYGLDAIRKPPRIHVGTIHSVKGGEADIVVVFPDITFAAARANDTTEGKDSLTRLFYVAFTRARETLYLAAPSSQFHEDFSCVI